MEPIQCPNCGKINDGTTDFCIYCGTIYDEYKKDEDDSNIFLNPLGGNNKERTPSNSMPKGLGGMSQKYKWIIIIGYFFAILGSVLGFIFAIYLVTRKDPNAKKHGLVQLVVLIAEYVLIGLMIYTGQMDPNVILNPFNTTNMTNMSQLYNSSAMNLTGSNNLSSLFGF